MQQNINSRSYVEEDEIDLRELFLTIWERKFFILIFTTIVTIAGVVFVFSQKPIYEVKGFVEIGLINNSNYSNSSKAIENPNNVVKKLEVLYQNFYDKEQLPRLEKVSVVKKAQNLIELSVYADSNTEGKQKLENILNNIKAIHNKIILNYINKIKIQINNLKKQKKALLDGKRFDGSEKIKFDIGREIDSLELKISDYNIKYTKLLGKMVMHKYPIKPQKKLIVAVVFITGLILSIFLVFFIQFIKSLKEDI